MVKNKLLGMALIVSLLALLASACESTSSPLPTVNPDQISNPLTGTMVVYVTDAPPDEEVTSIMVTLSELQVHKAMAEQEMEQGQSPTATKNLEQEQQQIQEDEGEWITIEIGGDQATFDLLLVRGIEQFMGMNEIETGKYTQVRLVIDNVQVKLGNGELQDATVPSGELKIMNAFDIAGGETTDLVLDFDADKMVTVTGNGAIIVKPVVKLTVRQGKGESQEGKETSDGETIEQTLVDLTNDDFTDTKQISKQVEVNVGDSFKVALSSNATTGFKWSESAQISDLTVIEQTKHQFVSPEDKQIIGAAGQEVWTFHAVHQGTTIVSMEYSQPWDGGEKATWEFALTVIVK
ncbi:DUF4382 domain-containing protein [Chloroflexota bacterium]